MLSFLNRLLGIPNSVCEVSIEPTLRYMGKLYTWCDGSQYEVPTVGMGVYTSMTWHCPGCGVLYDLSKRHNHTFTITYSLSSVKQNTHGDFINK